MPAIKAAVLVALLATAWAGGWKAGSESVRADWGPGMIACDDVWEDVLASPECASIVAGFN